MFNRRRRLDMQDIREIVFLRYGSLSNFDNIKLSCGKISKHRRIHVQTIHACLRRFIARDYDIDRMKIVRHQFKNLEEIKDFLIDHETLKLWSAYSLNERCIIIKKVFNI